MSCSVKVRAKYMAMQNDMQKMVDTGKLGGLSVSDFDCVCQVGRELLKRHVTSTFIKTVADFFKGYGFMVTMDFDNMNYVIVEV